MEEKDIDTLIGMLEDGIDNGNGGLYKFKREYESSKKIKRLLDKIGVRYWIDDEGLEEILILFSGEEQKIKDWLKENSKQLMEYIKTKDKKTIGKFALIFGEALDEDLLKEIINSCDDYYMDDDVRNYIYGEFKLTGYQRGQILRFIKDPEYLKYALENSYDLNIDINAHTYIHILKSLNDISKIKSYIEYDWLKFDEDCRVELLISLNEPDYTKK